MVIRRVVAAWCVSVAAVAMPPHAGAQQAAFAGALSELTTAIEGTYGDEGAHVRPAIERVSAALAAWDRDLDAAASRLHGAASGRPADVAEARVSLARLYAGRGRLAEALSELEAASRLAPTRADVHVLRGLVLRAAGTSADALEAFRTARALDPENPVIAYHLFHEALLGGHASDAREAAATLAAAYPALLRAAPPAKAAPFIRIGGLARTAAGPPLLPPAAYHQAFRELARGDGERAIAEFRKAASGDPLVADPAAASGSMMRAVRALREGRAADARRLLEDAGSAARSPEAQRVLGLVYWTESDYERSIASLTAAVNLSPRNERARLALARVLNAAGRDEDAERALHDTLRDLPDSALARWWLALAYERVNRFADARQELERAAAMAVSGESPLYAAIGRFAASAADYPGAIEAFARAVRAEPNDPAMHRLLAGALALQDRGSEALAEFVAALLIDPLDAEAHAGIGQIHLNAGRDADAVDALRRATELAPGSSAAHYALASALARLGRAADAAQHFARVEQLQRQMLADRRRTMSSDVLKEEASLRAAEGRLETAIALYEKALAIEADAAAYGRLADLYAQVGRAPDAARARALSEQARQAGPASGSPAR